MQWSGVELAIHSPLVITELQHCRRVEQAGTHADYIFGEYVQLDGAGPHAGSTAPEVHRHSRPSVPVPSGGHAITLRELLHKNDVFGLGYCMYNALLGDEVMTSRFPDVTSAAYRDWDLPELPAHLSKSTKQLLARMVAAEPAKRPSLG